MILLDKISGLEGSHFGTSIIMKPLEFNLSQKYLIGPYALTIKDKKVTEFEDYEHIKKETLKVLDDYESEKLTDEYFLEIRKTLEEGVELLKKINFEYSSDQELVNEFKRLQALQKKYYGAGAVSFVYEHRMPELANNLEKVQQYVEFENQNYKSFMLVFENKLNQLAKGIITTQELAEEFFYINTNFVYGEKPISFDTSITHNNEKELTKPDIIGRDLTIAKILSLTLPIRDLRKQVNLIAHYHSYRFIDEIVKRKNIKLELALKSLDIEFEELVFNTDKLIEKIKDRDEFTFYFDNEAKYLEGIHIKERIQTNELKGLIACKGSAKGTAKIILGPSDFHKFEQGDILVTEMTRPEFVPLMRKAAAIVTEEGGITSHAAIVSRELNVPCIVGVKNITNIIKDLDEIEVNANQGVVIK